MLQHKYLENIDEQIIRKHIAFALNNIDQFLTLATPQQRHQFIKIYFESLTTLIIAFNDCEAEIANNLHITIDSDKLLNILQKLSFYKEFRESPELLKFQFNLNTYLENYPNDITGQFIHIQPPQLQKFDKKRTAKQIAYKIFGQNRKKRQLTKQQNNHTKVVTIPIPNKASSAPTHKSFIKQLFEKLGTPKKQSQTSKTKNTFEKPQASPSKTPILKQPVRELIIEKQPKTKYNSSGFKFNIFRFFNRNLGSTETPESDNSSTSIILKDTQIVEPELEENSRVQELFKNLFKSKSKKEDIPTKGGTEKVIEFNKQTIQPKPMPVQNSANGKITYNPFSKISLIASVFKNIIKKMLYKPDKNKITISNPVITPAKQNQKHVFLNTAATKSEPKTNTRSQKFVKLSNNTQNSQLKINKNTHAYKETITTINTLINCVQLKPDDFSASLANILTYPEEYIEELVYIMEQTILKINNKIILNFTELDVIVSRKIITVHSEFMKKAFILNSPYIRAEVVKYIRLIEAIEKQYSINDLQLEFSKVNIEMDFAIAQYIAYKFHERIILKYFGEFELQKIFSKTDISINHFDHRNIKDLPVKTFNLNGIIETQPNDKTDLERIINNEQNQHDIAIILSISKYLEHFAKEIENYLKYNSRKNLFFLIHSKLTNSLAYIAAESLLTDYSRYIYTYSSRGSMTSIRNHTRKLFRSMSAEFIKKGYANHNDSTMFIFNLYKNLYFILDNNQLFTSLVERDEFIHEIIKGTLVQILEARLLPRQFYDVSIRLAQDNEKVYPYTNIAMDVFLIPQSKEEEFFKQYYETYVITYSEETWEQVKNLLGQTDNPTHVQKIINKIYDRNNLKTRLNSFVNKFKYEIKGEINLGKDEI